MKTIVKYLFFVFALTLSQLSWACYYYSDGDPRCPVCPEGTQQYRLNLGMCVDNPRSGYDCPEQGYICYEKCRDGYSSSGVATCHYTGGGTTYTKSCHTEKVTCSYYKGTKVIKKCSGGGTKCDDCRDGYADDGLICRYKGAWDYAKSSYTRTDTTKYKSACTTPGYVYDGGGEKGKCKCTMSLTATTSVSYGTFYSPKTKVTLTATASNVKACGAASIAKFTASFKDAANNEVATCNSTDGRSCSVIWDVPVGSYSIKSTISDTEYAGEATSAAIPVTVTAIPATLSITAPTNNASYLTTSSFSLVANSNIENGVVDFYKNNEGSPWVVCTLTAVPVGYCTYTVPANTLTAGSYSLQAKARGTTVVSAPIAFTITSPVVPTVSITSPTAGASYSPTDTISLAATSNTSGITIDFYKNTETSVWNSCSIVAPATSCSTTSSASIGTGGSNTVVAKIRGTNTTSSAVSFTVGATVTMTSPVNNASYARSSTIPLTVTSNVANGVVDFYKNNETSPWVACTIGTTSTTSCTYTVPGNILAVGSYSMKAKVRGTTATSSTVNFTVTP